MAIITSFADKRAQQLFYRQQRHKRLPDELQRLARRKLVMPHRAARLEDLRTPPSNHLEKLKGDRKDQFSIRINDAWRICFHWRAGQVHGVEIVNYHRG